MTTDNILFKYLGAINQTKKDYLLNPECEESLCFRKEYNPYVINTFLSLHVDTVLFANEMNTRYYIPAARQFVFLLHAIRPKRRYGKFPRKHVSKDLELVSRYYNCSLVRAREYLKLHTEEQLIAIRELYAESATD